MIGLRRLIYNTLSQDATIQSYVGSNVTTKGVDELEMFPAITISEAGSRTSTFPVKGRMVMIQVTIWSIKSSLEVETIYQRVWQLMNYVKANAPTGEKNYWSLEEMVDDEVDHDRRIWYKVAKYRFWIVG